MVRTLLIVGLSLGVGMTSVLVYQRVHVQVQTTVQTACPASAPQTVGLMPMETTYTPQGRLLPMPGAGKEP